MKDVRFYLEFPSSTAKHKSGKGNLGHSGNVFAAYLWDGRLEWHSDGHTPGGVGVGHGG